MGSGTARETGVAARSRQRDDWFDGAPRRLHGDARVAAVRLFGSLARGDADELSDVDMSSHSATGMTASWTGSTRCWVSSGSCPGGGRTPTNAPDGGRYIEAVYPADLLPLIVDSYWQPIRCAALAADTRVVFDRVGLPHAPPGITTDGLIPSVRDRLAFVAPDDPVVRLREQAAALWSDLAIVAKDQARRLGHADEEAAALWSVLDQVAADTAVALARRCPPGGLQGLAAELDRVLAAAGLEGVDAAARANAYAWLHVCEALRDESWVDGPGGVG